MNDLKKITINGVTYDVAPGSHLEDKNNPHGVTAEQVGARPDTWMPTASDVGAAPAGYGLGGTAKQLADCDLNGIVDNGWYCYNKNAGVTNVPSETPSLLFVENFYNTNFCKQTVTLLDGKGTSYVRMRHSGTWMPWTTLAEAHGSAPSGYGLGEHPSTVITNPDTITKSGFYKAVCTFSEYYKDITAWVEMIASSENYATQHAYFDMHEGVKLTRYKIAGVWQPWEWNNPPMGIGIEFRTTERWNGKVVYTQAFNAGAMVNSSYVSYPVNNLKYIIRGSAMLSNGTCLPFDVHGPSGSNFATVYFAQYEMWMHCGSSQTGKTVYAQIWYTKEELA